MNEILSYHDTISTSSSSSSSSILCSSGIVFNQIKSNWIELNQIAITQKQNSMINYHNNSCNIELSTINYKYNIIELKINKVFLIIIITVSNIILILLIII
jgi:hypothetical protein